ncbi:peptidase T [Lutibacter sp. TH_r2]|uniref:peptidase T n=1 Tax=Lutibacter sp. TH_r2 TaxID=3082083 RepID=UPI00295492A5|nr:peptidase T [Lutibacter sp. TH_r2]MDV7188278.1 peptidase T [Lutibacter sp. TH_r2]
MQQIIDRFVKYITIDTQSDETNPAFPSTEKQWDLAKVLIEDLKEIGMEDVTIDDNCYIMATLPSNVDFEVPTIGFIAHIDTSPDYSGTNVKPQFHPNYNGEDIVLNKEENIVLSPSYFEDLLLYKGQTLITTDGTTLLGADDKAGITEIMEAMDYLIKHPEIKHGKIRVGFTPDEEVGKGAHMFDVDKFGAEWAYTMDGSQVGELEYENFNAAGAKITINGKIVHPGYAKGKMINSMLIASEFIAALPKNEIPQETEGYEGFFHLHTMKGEVEKSELYYIIRDHDMKLFQGRKVLVEEVVAELNTKYGEGTVEVEIKDQYFNMREKVEPVMHIVDIAEEAMKQLNIKPLIKAIRGGTDGSQLSYKGLPCPNIFAGGHNFHGRYEYVPAESMELARDVIVKIASLTAEKQK